MKWQAAVLLVSTVCLLSGCGEPLESEQAAASPVPEVVTADIQAGIEKHIEDRSREGGGYFTLAHGDRELRLKLVKVHTEYLATLGPRRHFACIDLADVNGDVYDVDFFLEGDPGQMVVTETIVHKFNGQPLYAWKQNEDRSWSRVPVDEATPRLLGVVSGKDRFEFLYRATLPEIDDSARMWVPLPQSDAFQTVEIVSIDAPGEQQTLEEKEHGNQVLFLTLGPEDSGQSFEMRVQVERRERGAHPAEAPSARQHLSAQNRVPENEVFREIAEKVVAGKSGDLVRARALYDHVIDRMRYAKSGEGWGQGDALFACDAARGNCTDFHSYFIALSRSVGIPARFAIGAAVPSERNDGGVDGYHCWAEFYAEDKWWPVDISEADKCSSLASYYFGHHPANRVELSRGRDLVVEPGPRSGPINFLAYPVLEIAGKPAKAKIQFSFRRDVSVSD